MISTPVTIPDGDVKRLLAAANPDCALLYLYIHSGNSFDSASADLQIPANRLSLAAAGLRQLGLWPEDKIRSIAPGERPNYSAQEVIQATDFDPEFKTLCAEVERHRNYALGVEDLKILLSFQRYLGLPTDVVLVLISYCRERARSRGNTREPSLRQIEKEAYLWAEQGIDTMEEAAAYIQRQNIRGSRIENLQKLLHIQGRPLSRSEERYAQSWVEMGFADEAIALAYDRTCTNTGHLNWNYMNKILTRWHNAGLHTAEAIASGDRKDVPRGAKGELGDAELEAIAQLMKEG